MAAVARIGDLLVEAGMITRQQLNDALRQQAHAGGRLGTNLVELGFVDEKTLATFLAKQLSLPAVTAASIDRIRPQVLDFIPATLAEKLRVIPIREDAGKLWVAMTDPTDKNALAELERVSRMPVRPMVSPELLMQYALEKHYKVRRKPRVVEVRTGSSDLLWIEDHARRVSPASVQAAQAAPPEIPNAFAAQATDQLDAVTGYIDESPEVAAPAKPATTFLEMKDLVTQLAAATSDETVLDLAARFLAQDIPRVWVFLLKQSELWSWGGRGLDTGMMREVHAPLAELPLVAQALSSGEVLAGRIQPQMMGRLAAPLGVWNELLGVILPVRIGKHAVGVIFGIDASLEAMRRKAEIAKLAQKVDQALHINYLRRLLLQV